jgi:hypothetical protein
MENDQELKASLKAQRLSALTQMKEWEEVLLIMTDEFEGAFQKMISGSHEDVLEGRGGIKAVENILSKIHNDIKYGQECRKRLYSKMVKPLQHTDSATS